MQRWRPPIQVFEGNFHYIDKANQRISCEVLNTDKAGVGIYILCVASAVARSGNLRVHLFWDRFLSEVGIKASFGRENKSGPPPTQKKKKTILCADLVIWLNIPGMVFSDGAGFRT